MGAEYTKEEIEINIKKEKKYLERVENDLKYLNEDRKRTKGAIIFWENMLKKKTAIEDIQNTLKTL